MIIWHRNWQNGPKNAMNNDVKNVYYETPGKQIQQK
jgi:hypothetical protein